jgi:membrane-bound lytic murein transglycosylase D
MQNLITIIKISLLAAVIILGGCAANARQVVKPVSDPPAVKADTCLPDTALPSTDSITELHTAGLCPDIETFIQDAVQAGSAQEWGRADSLLRYANTLITLYCAELENDSGLTESYYNRIINLYTEILPPEYFDSIPGNIGLMIFQRQLTVPFDTSGYLPFDSTRPLFTQCRDGIPYNVPIVWNSRVQKSLSFIMQRRPTQVEHWLGQANIYLPFVRRCFADSGLPTDLAYLPLIESSYNPLAYSRAHASGIWQFIPSTGKHYGLRSGYWLDERRDPMQSTRAAIKYLKKLNGDFNDWYLALAAYNCGEGGLGRAMARKGSSDFWQLPLPRETQNYVPYYLAALMVAKNPHCFGFNVPEADTFAFDTVSVSDCIDLHKIADAVGIPFEKLKQLNPHILRWCTPPDVDNVRLYLPLGQIDTFKAFYAALGAEDKIKWYVYKIRHGDNLGTLARRFKMSVDVIMSLNHLTSNRIGIGQTLHIPIPVNSSYPEDRSSIKKSIPPAHGDREAAANRPTPKSGSKTFYRVKPGDTFYGLATLFGVSVDDLRNWNSLGSSDQLKAGMTLTVYTLAGNKQTAVQPTPLSTGRGTAAVYTVKSGDNLFSIAGALGAGLEQLARWNAIDLDIPPLLHPGQDLRYYPADCPDSKKPLANKPAAPGAAKTKRVVYYKVKHGDTLWNIAQLFNVTIDHIYQVNDLARDAVIQPGSTLRIMTSEDL